MAVITIVSEVHCQGGGRVQVTPFASLNARSNVARSKASRRFWRAQRGGTRTMLAGERGFASFRNCAAARAAGAAPIRAGDPGYGRHLDRDGDSVGCE